MSNLDKYIISDDFIKDRLSSISEEAKTFYENQKNYQEFVACQKSGFLKLMNHINQLLTEYRDSGKISSFVEFRARIKSPASAMANDSKKLLDDVFGMELICATEQEIDFLIEEITKLMEICREPHFHDKPNGYKAKHYSLALAPENLNSIYPNKNFVEGSKEFDEEISKMPVIEFQFKTIAVAINASYGTAAHTNYKQVDPEKIQEDFDNNNLKRGNNLPYMWVSSMNSSGKPTMKELDNDEVAKKLYPFLDVTRQREIN